MATGSEIRPEHPRLTRSDAWVLAALTYRRHADRPAELWELLENADWLNRAIPTFDELGFGLQRLVASGYLSQEGSRVVATHKALELRQELAKAGIPDWVGGPVEAVEGAFGTPPWPAPEEEEDRSLGRLPGLTREDVAEARYRAWFRRWEVPSIVAAIVVAVLLAPVVLLAAVIARVVCWRRAAVEAHVTGADEAPGSREPVDQRVKKRRVPRR